MKKMEMNQNKKENRSFFCDVVTRSDEQHGNVIDGVPIVFDKETDFGFCKEVIDSGALNQTDLKDVRFLINHDTDQLPLARSRNNNANSTMQLSVQEDGLHVRVDLDTENNSRARELYSAVNRQDCSGMSFMFTVDGERWEGLDTEKPVRHITSISKVFEVSAVTFPAYDQTSINARSLESVKASLESEQKKAKADFVEERRKALKARAEQLARKDSNE